MKRVNLNEDKIKEMYQSEMSVHEIGEILGLHGTLIHSRLKKMGTKLRTLSEAQKIAHKTGRAKSMFKPMEKHPYWKGGKSFTGKGHILLKIPNHPNSDKKGYILEHRMIWEKTYNKKIPRAYDIHYLNGIKTDNRPENLVAIKHNEHRNLSEPFKKRIRELEIQIELLRQKTYMVCGYCMCELLLEVVAPRDIRPAGNSKSRVFCKLKGKKREEYGLLKIF